MQITRSVFVGAVLAGKRLPGEAVERWELESPHRPRFGRYWWYWWPAIRSNGGRFRQHECTDINFHWLCLCLSLTVFPWQRRRFTK
jgi:hypothetical protein